jgi:hypothetical protein
MLQLVDHLAGLGDGQILGPPSHAARKRARIATARRPPAPGACNWR